MSRRRGTASIGASPVLIGAATVLVALVAVFIAYNANSGLPFVPTYDLNAELPSGGKLVKGNEVRVGGFRVGVVKDIKPKRHDGERRAPQRGRRRAQSRQEGRAARRGHPVPRASALGARPQVHRASARHEQGHLAVRRHGPGQAVLRAARVRGPLLDLRPRDAPATSRAPPTASATPSPAAARRSTASIEALNPFFKALTPVMRNLSDPDTELDQFFLQIGPRVRAGGAGGPNAGAAVHRHGGHVRGHLREPARAPGHDREGRADDGRLDRLVPSPAAVHAPTSPTSRARLRPAARASCRARCPQSTAPSRSARRCCRGRSS